MGAFLPLANIIFPKYIVDSIFQQRDINMGVFWTLALVGTTSFVQYFSTTLGYLLAKEKNKLFTSFNVYIAELIMDMDYKELENPKTLDMKEKAMRSAFSGGRGFCGSVEVFFGIIKNILIFLFAALKISEFNPMLILVILLVVWVNALFNRKTLKDNYKLDQEKAPIERKNSYIFNTINDFTIGKETRLYNMNDYILNKYKKTSEESNRFYNKAFLNNTKNSLLSTTTASFQLVVIYIVLMIQVLNNSNLTYGDFTVQFNAVNTLSQSLMTIVTSILTINQMGFYIDDLTDFVKLPRMIKDIGDNVPNCKTYTFEFVNVSFKYPGSTEFALHEINIKFSSEQKLSFVGLNGAGKTTFIKLLLRLYDVTSGVILLNGKNIQEYNYNEYMRLFASVFQDYKLFAYSIVENIVLDECEFDNLRLENALYESGVNEFLKEKQRDMNSYLYKIFDSSGFEPSGGEGQKIAIARALYKDARFIILDEPTSALDPIAEYNLYQKLNNIIKGRGCLFISHRLSSTVFADKIYVFNNGRIVEEGNHKELMSHTDGLYKDMFDKQSSYYKEG